MKRPFLFIAILILLLAACQEADPMTEGVPEVESGVVHGRLTPPDGKTLFIVGQDVESVAEYVAQVGPAPGGFTEYTSLDNLEGITRVASYGSGPHHLDQMAASYPHSTIALGLNLVGYLPALPSGQADHKIDLLLDHLERYDRPVYLRFGYEFDGEWNHYAPDDYVAAWIYFYDKMQARGVENVAMVWQSATYCGGTFQGHPITAWYPGDEYVDWMGLSYFTQSDCDFAPLEELVAFAREHNKPVMIAESTPQRYDTKALTVSSDGSTFASRTADAIWTEWFAPYFAFIHDNADIIRAVAYINARWDDQPMWGPPYASGYWGDSRVQANPTIKQNWQAELGRETWLHAHEDLFDMLSQ